MDLTEFPCASFTRHPWELVRARFFRRLLQRANLLATRIDILDVGAGDGYFARSLLDVLPPGSRVVCHDAYYTDEDLERFSSSAPPGLTFSRTPQAGRFDLILLLDVLEHVPDDQAFLTELVDRNLAASGSLLISVPAWGALFSKHDEALKHYRRYSPAECRSVLAKAALVPQRQGGLFHSLFIARLLAVAVERVKKRLGRLPSAPPNLGDWRGGQVLTSAVEGALAIDAAFAQFNFALPALTFWALCNVSSRAEI